MKLRSVSGVMRCHEYAKRDPTLLSITVIPFLLLAYSRQARTTVLLRGFTTMLKKSQQQARGLLFFGGLLVPPGQRRGVNCPSYWRLALPLSKEPLELWQKPRKVREGW